VTWTPGDVFAATTLVQLAIAGFASRYASAMSKRSIAILFVAMLVVSLLAMLFGGVALA
jgi:hypothetical protein